jgi:hypothetical protein
MHTELKKIIGSIMAVNGLDDYGGIGRILISGN